MRPHLFCGRFLRFDALRRDCGKCPAGINDPRPRAELSEYDIYVACTYTQPPAAIA